MKYGQFRAEHSDASPREQPQRSARNVGDECPMTKYPNYADWSLELGRSLRFGYLVIGHFPVLKLGLFFPNRSRVRFRSSNVGTVRQPVWNGRQARDEEDMDDFLAEAPPPLGRSPRNPSVR